jgi:hypothetical protein
MRLLRRDAQRLHRVCGGAMFGRFTSPWRREWRNSAECNFALNARDELVEVGRRIGP